MILPVVLYVALFLIAAIAPLRWSIVAYLLLATIDFGATSANVGMLNAAKGTILPVYLLWRLRTYSGHERTIVAPIVWILLVIYVGIAGFWSFFPLSALKLAVEMAGSFLICMVFLRATKAQYLTPAVVLPVTIGALAIAVLRSIFAPRYGDEAVRFTGFLSAQAFAAFIVALYCIALCSKTLRAGVRVPLCVVLAASLAFDGSRIWAIGMAIATLLALLVSEVRPWMKICGVGLAIAITALLAGSMDTVMTLLAEHAESNRIAAAITAFYEGDLKSYGLGTYNFRRGLEAKEIGAIADSSLTQLVFGHGTSNGALVVTGSLFKGNLDPNRLMHDEWLRVMYEWGLIGLILWLMFFGSIAMFAVRGVQRDQNGYAKPLLVYLPAFMLGLTGENILAGAGSAANIGFLMLLGLAGMAHRQPRQYSSARVMPPISFEPAVSAKPR